MLLKLLLNSLRGYCQSSPPQLVVDITTIQIHLKIAESDTDSGNVRRVCGCVNGLLIEVNEAVGRIRRDQLLDRRLPTTS